ncbi:hypothetical protein QQP08_024422 [Theobroma cacao]|nr:hypothetical protein QQP08_024422 [Theobroma cacao]
MGNKPVKQEQREEILLKIVPPLDQAYVRWLARDIERIHGFTPRNPRAVKPPDHYIEYMRLNGLCIDNFEFFVLLVALTLEMHIHPTSNGTPFSVTRII